MDCSIDCEAVATSKGIKIRWWSRDENGKTLKQGMILEFDEDVEIPFVAEGAEYPRFTISFLPFKGVRVGEIRRERERCTLERSSQKS